LIILYFICRPKPTDNTGESQELSDEIQKVTSFIASQMEISEAKIVQLIDSLDSHLISGSYAKFILDVNKIR
jgi:hypothetical protein